jgi:hypothetical protein
MVVCPIIIDTMHDSVKVGDWVRSYSVGIWRVWRVLSGFNELRFSLDAPKSPSSRTLIFSHRLVNTSWKRSFSMECAEASLVSWISPDEESRVQQLLESNTPLKKAFEKYRAENSTLDLVVNVSLGQIPGSDRERLRAACDLHLGATHLDTSIENGLTMDEVLIALRNAGYYDCIGKTPITATVRLISVNHEVRDHEFLLRYKRVVDF